MSLAEGSRAAYSLADSEFHPSSLGHSLQFDPTCEQLVCVCNSVYTRTPEHLNVVPDSKLFIHWRSIVSAVTQATLPNRPWKDNNKHVHE